MRLRQGLQAAAEGRITGSGMQTRNPKGRRQQQQQQQEQQQQPGVQR